MITSHSLDRKLSSAGASGSRPFSPYSRPLTTGGTQQQDKSTLLWKDFLHSVSKRKSILERFAEAALGSSTPLPVLKKTLIELRQITLAIVEDALELEYQTRVASSSGRSSSKKGSRGNRLPPINTYNTMHDHEEIYALTEMINDCEELFGIPNVKVMLPVSFPSIRNPFMLGKTIDELATIVPPHPEPGNVEDELKSLELLRFKRASRALLRAEAQILNRLPLNLYEIERLLNRMKDDNNVEVLIRCVCTLIDNDRVGTVDQEADLTCLLSPLFTVEAHELLRKLNEYRGVNPMRVDVKVLIKQKLRVCNFDYLMEEMVPKFLLEWIQVIIGGNDSPQRQEYENPSFHLDQPSHQLQRESTISRQGVRSSYSRSTGLNNLASVDQIKSYQKDENDLTSVVDSTTGHVKTHENIHSPSEPRRKVKMKPAVQEMSQQTYGEKERSIAVGGETMDHVDDEDNVATSKKTLHFQSPKKDKVGMTNANDKRINISIKQKIRQEVEKAIKEMSKTLNPIQRNTDFGDNGDDSYQPGNFDALSSVRYELNKMQQELLRRQVLDPRHYTVTSVDAITHAKRGLTVDNLNAFDPLHRRTQQVTSEQSLMPVEIASKVIKVPQTEDSSTFMSLLNTIILRPETNDLLCTVSLSYDDAVKYGFIKDESSTSLRVNRSAQILTYFTVSPLIFSKLNTEYTIQDLIETKPEHRKRLMQNIFEQMDKICRILPLPRGSFVLPLDRSLFTKQFAEDNVLVDLLISRNLDCNGLQVQCTPIAGLFGAGGIGPVTITISDYELEVLLISQHGLFDKGKQRWDSMAVIANWIAGRLHVRKVLTNTSIEVLAPKPAHSIANDLESVASQLTYENEDAANAANTLTTKNMTTTYKGKDAITSSQSLLMLEVYIDRHIDISTTLIDHWKSRNVAKILGLDVSISARQDLETMEILVTILVPSKLTHKKLLDEQDIQHADEKGGKKKKGLLTFDTYSSDDDEDEYAYEEDNTTEIKLSYRLTRAELLIFGSTELIENHMKIGMSKNATHTPQIQENATTAVEILQENHPEKMMWNILNRLKINFKGSKDNPFKASASAKDIENWSVVYDRLLVRDVKTISQMILMLSAAAIGSDILLEARPVDTNFKHPIGKKIVSEGEVKEMVYSEGWEIKLLEYKLRKDLSALLLDKLKIVQEASATSTDKLSKEYRIELSSYVENRMILITRIGAPPNHHKKGKDVPDVDHELELGYVEINNHHTLSDLRIVIKHELDSDDLPTQYRFLYKGTVCSLRQETFRRAWECLPTCYITPKAIMTSEAGVETEDIAKRRMEKIVKKEGPKMLRLTKSQRRAPGKYVPVPLPTLCIVEEGKSTVYLLNEAKELLTPGDIIRLGHPKGRDYIVIKIGITIPLDEQQNLGSNQGDDINLKAIEIEPEYDLISEPDFSIPIFKNSPYPNNPKTNGLYMNEKGKIIKLLKSKEAMGYRYQIPKQMIKAVYPEAVQSKKMSTFQKKASLKGKLIQSKSTLGKLASDEDDNFLNTTTGDEFDNNSDYDSNTSNANQNVGDKVLIARSLKDNKQKSLKGVKNLGSRIYTDVWIWRCIPAKEDTRPKWRQLYDDGEVRYSYEFGQSDEFFEHFRIKAYYSYLEILCTDARCSYLSLYAQRVNEMKNIPVEYYMKLIFEKLTNWSPVYKQGIERTKFIKLIRDVNAFPDLKRPARLAQIDNYFQKIVKTPAFGIVQKYVSFSGFCQLVKELSVIRFPPKKNKDGNNNPKDGDANAGTVAATSAGNTKSEGVGPDAVAENNNEDDASVMTDDISSIASGDNNANKDKNRVRPRRFGMPGASTNSSETGDANANNNNPMNVLANIDPEYIQQAYQKFILDYLMMYPNWYDEPWKEVKLVAMQKESIRYCAVTRIIATYRGFHRKKLYRFFLRQHTKLQAQIRRKLTQKWYRGVVRLLVEDYLYRQRYYYMTKIQSIVRRFIKRCWYSHVLEQLKRQQIILLRARRQKKKKINEIRKKGLMYSEVKKMNGVTVLIRVYRRDPRNYTKDFGINVEAYIPKTQAVFKFPIEDPELRSYLQILLEKPALSSGDILSKQNIKDLLITRLIVLKGSNKFTLPTIIFSRHALGQKGEKILTHAISILKEYFICKIFETIEDITVQCYHQKTSKIFTAKITIKELHRWIRDEFITETVLIRNKEKQKLLEAQGASITGFGKKITTKKPILLNSIALATSDLNSQAGDSTAEIVAQREKAKSKNKMEVDINAVPDPNGDTVSVVTTDDNATLSAEEELFQIKTLEPYLLKAENKKKYYEWILRHLVIDTRNRRFQVLFKNQLEKSRKKEMLIKIQAAWRRALVPPVVIALLDEVYLKVRSSPEEPDAYYYINRLTGVSSWDKPKLLRHYELPTQPVVSRWVPMYYQQDGIVYTHYVNPFTGKYTHLIPDQAAKVIQRLARRYLLKVIRMPKDHFIKAAGIYMTAEQLYETSYNPLMERRKLSHVINYAIVLHVLDCKEAEAKEVYREAVELSESNPLVTRCYAFFLISTCEPPMLLNRDRALLLLGDAKRKDDDHSRFTIAHYLFELAVLRQPTNYVTLVNLALVNCLIYNNNYKAEKLLRRALAVAPFEERVMEIWKWLKDRFPERVLLYNPMSRINRMKASVDEAVKKAGKELKIIHGRPVVENDQWAGWVYVPDDKFKASKTIKDKLPYWYNPADGAESLDPPDFIEQWRIRKERSHYQVTEYGLEQYFDPLTSAYFQYHPLTDTYS